MRRAFLAAAFGLAGLALLAVRLRATYLVVRVRGDSMAPALAHGDRLLSRRTHLAALRNGQIAVVLSPPRTGAGSWSSGSPPCRAIRFRRWCGRSSPTTSSPAGRFVLIGDNAEVSFDSREHGFFDAGDLRAVTIRKLEPQHGRRRREAGVVA
ncbi:hypothetical protein GCM10020220_039880 [Nonomuraea rubra]|uniref:S24/S26 family peptidase n=1 Tax=Nonomuraea rubra TaxID=46180 RepID=UPI0031E5B1C9